MPHRKRHQCKRYLSLLAYRRLGAALRDAEAADSANAAIIHLLLHTGAHVSETGRLVVPNRSSGAGQFVALTWGMIVSS